MKRRAFLFAAAAFAASLAIAQRQSNLPRIALVDSTQPTITMVEGSQSPWSHLISELRLLGYVEGKNITLERWSGAGAGNATVYRELSRKVASSNPQAIVVRGGTMFRSVASESGSIPVVAIGTIPAELRLRNVTGVNVSFDAQQLYGKQVEVLGAVLKPGARIAWLGPKIVWDGTTGEAARKAAHTAKLTLHPVLVSLPISRSTIRLAFAEMARAKYDAVLISPATELTPFREAISELAVARNLPSLGAGSYWAEAGTLLGYGADLDHLYRRGAHFVDQILKGTQPAALPIENPTKIDLIVNLETAKSLNLAIPQTILQRADRVIQ